ncbi:uncharacterized protein [Clytia hemisphaerica]|uniref:Innexin n=1 Tax=Clytia hemisphaerica TaxID=252671 RepID=A0A7M5VF13_9CNID|eukprot:TCONS_00024463-protein
MTITEDIKDIISINIKPRYDSWCDQFTRIFMVKLMTVGALILGMNWYSDKFTCVVPSTLDLDVGFVSQACWINGLYVYEEIRYHADDVGYYGIPTDMTLDGIHPQSGEMCATINVAHKITDNCKPMKKTFFLQFQYMTFVMALLALLYYFPYAIHRLVNEDLGHLQDTMMEETVDAEEVVKNFFNKKYNMGYRMRMRIFGSIIVKVLYIACNLFAFLALDFLLNHQYMTYGVKWINWVQLPNEIAYDYMGVRHYPKPGNELLPAFGFCDVREASRDMKQVVTNKHRFICEISPHTLYQYTFIVTWFFMILSTLISMLGFLLQIFDHAFTIPCFLKSDENARKMYSNMTLRECQYLEFIQQNDMTLYENVLQKLKEERYCAMVGTLTKSQKMMLMSPSGDTTPLFNGNTMEMKEN